jgi:hypothetical protein
MGRSPFASVNSMLGQGATPAHIRGRLAMLRPTSKPLLELISLFGGNVFRPLSKLFPRV